MHRSAHDMVRDTHPTDRMPRMNRLRDKTTELFGIDLRSLAAFRIGVAGVLLVDLWYRSREITAYFTDQGVLPRTARIELAELGREFGMQHQWSLHMMSGDWWEQAFLFCVAAFFAIWMLIGYRTRLAAFVSWLLLMSLDGRNPDILNSGDILLRCMLLWSLFLPMGARFSIDSLFTKSIPALPRRVLSTASVALLLQLCMMYWFSSACKMKSIDDMLSPWTHGYSAVYYALNCDAYTSRIGLWLRQFPTTMQFLTVSSLWLEIVGPMLAFMPWQTRWFRGGVVGVFIAFHICLGMVLTIGLFPIICIVSWFAFIPSEFWEWIEQRASTGRSQISQMRHRTERLVAIARQLFRRPEQPVFAHRWYIELPLATLLLYLVVWNVREVDFVRLEPSTMPRSWNAPARVLGLDQNWSMFAPLPRTEDGWLVMEGTLKDGSIVNLWEFDEPLPWDKPEVVSATYKTQRWRKYLDNLTTEPYGPNRMYFCDWLARRWDNEQASGNSSREVDKVELSHRIELTPPPGNPMPEPETRVLWTWYYE